MRATTSGSVAAAVTSSGLDDHARVDSRLRRRLAQTDRPRAGSRMLATVVHPRRAISTAAASPMPLEVPVIRTEGIALPRGHQAEPEPP
jgi:hypothetical protein